MKEIDLDELASFLDHVHWVVLKVSVKSVGATEKLPETGCHGET